IDVVDQDVQAAVFGGHAGKQVLYLLGNGVIHPHRDSGSAMLGHHSSSVIYRFRTGGGYDSTANAAARAKHDGSSLSEHTGYTAAGSACRPGYHCDFPFERFWYGHDVSLGDTVDEVRMPCPSVF